MNEGHSPDSTVEVNNTSYNEGKSSSSFLDDGMDSLLDELSGEERQLLEQENDHLYKELMSNREEVRQITRQVRGYVFSPMAKARPRWVICCGFVENSQRLNPKCMLRVPCCTVLL